MQILCRLLIVGLTSFSGVFLSLVRIPLFGNCLNFCWESVYGLGFFLVAFLPTGLESRPGFVFGALIWPILVATSIYIVSGWILRRRSAKVYVVAVTIAILSLLLVVPLNVSAKFPFSYLPLYSHFMYVIY
jgi:hypothetical protein